MVITQVNIKEIKKFVGAKFFAVSIALIDSNKCIWIKGKMLESSSTMLSSLYNNTVNIKN